MSKIPDDYFLDIDDDMLNYLENESKECFKGVDDSINKNKDNADKILNILILGIGSAFLLLTQKEHVDFLYTLLLIFSILWSIVAVVLIRFCSLPSKKALLYSMPSCNYTKPYKNIDKNKVLGLMRRYNLISMEITISEYLLYNRRVAKWLKRVMYATAITPLLSLVMTAIFYLCFV